MKRQDILNKLNALFEEKKTDMKKGQKDKKDKKDSKPYVEDADYGDQKDDKDDKKKSMVRGEKGSYSKLSSTGVGDSTVAEETLEEGFGLSNTTKKKLFKIWFGSSVKDVVRDVHELDDKELKFLLSNINDKAGGAQKVQNKALRKEANRRNITLNEEVIEESIDSKIKKEIDSMKKKGKDEITILMEIDKKRGKKLSKRDMEDIAEYLSDD